MQNAHNEMECDNKEPQTRFKETHDDQKRTHNDQE